MEDQVAHCRIVDAGRNLSRLSSLSPLLKQRQLEQAAQNSDQLGFECLHGWRLHSLWATY